MGTIIGTDEAGYGPNLGPLLITATSWSVPGEPREFDFWTAFDSVVSQKKEAGKLHVADSKQVYSSSKGIVSLERNVLPVLRICFGEIDSFRDLTRQLIGATGDTEPHKNLDSDTHPFDVEPWFEDADIQLPLAADGDDIERSTEELRTALENAQVTLNAIQSDIVLTERFNELCEINGTKGAALSRTTFQLIRHQWDPDSAEPTFVIGDKHGGRNRYLDLIYEQLNGQWGSIIQEGRERSSYSVGKTRLQFQTGAESHFPVAVASMVCKYIRELSMELFNAFWQSHIEDLKTTKGYPQDARRFKMDISKAQAALGVSNKTLWRER